MRLLLLGLVSLSACDGLTWGPHGDPVSESGLLMSRSSAYAQLDSAAMSDDGQVFFAVMAGTTWCSFQAEDAYMDLDTTADTEIGVQDIHADVPLVVTRDGLAYIDSNGTTSDYWTVASVEAARFRSDAAGAVALTSDGRLNWFDGVTTTDRDRVGNCTALAFDRAGDVAWLACPSGLVRATPGEATVVENSLLATAAWVLSGDLTLVQLPQYQTHPKVSMRRPLTYSYAARDGKLIQLMILNAQPRWAALCKVFGLEEIESDPRFATDDARNSNGDALIEILTARIATRDFADWEPLLEAIDIPWELISSIEDVTKDPQIHANGMMRKMAVGEVQVDIVAGPTSFDEKLFSREPVASPKLGADTAELLAQAGYSAEAIADMKARAIAA